MNFESNSLTLDGGNFIFPTHTSTEAQSFGDCFFLRSTWPLIVTLEMANSLPELTEAVGVGSLVIG